VNFGKNKFPDEFKTYRWDKLSQYSNENVFRDCLSNSESGGLLYCHSPTQPNTSWSDKAIGV
jgi:hypothetical protein